MASSQVSTGTGHQLLYWEKYWDPTSLQGRFSADLFEFVKVMGTEAAAVEKRTHNQNRQTVMSTDKTAKKARE